VKVQREERLIVLALTEDATEAIEGLSTAPGVPDGAGVRITPAASAVSTAEDLLVVMAREPADTDEVLEEPAGRLRVFIADEVAEFLDDKLLDAELVEDRVLFSLEEQPE
jgi:iron-sulfur cluster assembly protein